MLEAISRLTERRGGVSLGSSLTVPSLDPILEVGPTNRVLLVFNVRSVDSVWPALTQSVPRPNLDVTVSDVRDGTSRERMPSFNAMWRTPAPWFPT